MSFGFGFGLPSWQTLSGGFSPASLFTGGEQGAWYDPSDLTTLFTDSAGTTPVTAVEQFVGLMLDKSKGLVLGPELVDTANTAAAWTPYGSNTVATISNGVAITFVSDARGALLFFNAAGGLSGNLNSTKIYRFSITLQLNTGTATASLTNATPAVSFPTITTTPQTVVFYTTRTAFTPELAFDGLSSGEILSVTNISVRELPGNHATQTTSAKRPKLAARYNLLTYSEQFDNGAWLQSAAAVTDNAVAAPDGAVTADYLYQSSGTTSGFLYRTLLLATSAQYTATLYAKAKEKNFLVIGGGFTGANQYAWFDLQNGVTGSQSGAFTSLSISNAGNGWYKCGITFTATTASANLFVRLADTDNSLTVTATGGIYIWGADFRPASQATGLIGPTYQRVVDAATYDTAGFLPYLSFDGIDDSMSTGSIDFTAGDKMTVWAGARKNLDQFLILSEFSTNLTSNNGAFGIYPGTVNIGSFGARGTTFRQADSASGAWSTPATAVLCGQADIAQPVTSIRVNGTQSNNTASLGTGNYGNYPLYIGARGGSTFPFNGWLTSLIVRGAQSTQSQIEATESWVAGKTGVSL